VTVRPAAIPTNAPKTTWLVQCVFAVIRDAEL
jgi:hypothetical protein